MHTIHSSVLEKIQVYHQQLLENSLLKIAAYWQIGALLNEATTDMLPEITNALKPHYSTTLLKKITAFFSRFPNWTDQLLLLSWSHYLQLLALKNTAACTFYFQEALLGQWTNRQLKRQIKTNIWERTAFTPPKNTPVQIRTPYTFEFIPAAILPILLEKELEALLIQHLPDLLLELGNGFSFVARQQPLRLPSGKQFFVDLVFYQNLHKCYVILDLKMTELSHQDIGQMDMYVRLYDEKWKRPEDKPTIGIILCPKKDVWLEKYSALSVNPQLFAATYQF